MLGALMFVSARQSRVDSFTSIPMNYQIFRYKLQAKFIFEFRFFCGTV